MKKITDIIKHLKSRDVDLKVDKVFINEELCTATFPLYNLSGQWVGYQHYNPNGPKGRHSANKNIDVRDMKYQSRITKWDNRDMLAVYGLDKYNPNAQYLYVVEGIFDCIKLHRLGLNAIAVLANDPKHLRNWLRTLSQKIVVISDNDENLAGNKLLKYGDYSFMVPNPFNDLGDMNMDEVRRFIWIKVLVMLRNM